MALPVKKSPPKCSPLFLKKIGHVVIPLYMMMMPPCMGATTQLTLETFSDLSAAYTNLFMPVNGIRELDTSESSRDGTYIVYDANWGGDLSTVNLSTNTVYSSSVDNISVFNDFSKISNIVYLHYNNTNFSTNYNSRIRTALGSNQADTIYLFCARAAYYAKLYWNATAGKYQTTVPTSAPPAEAVSLKMSSPQSTDVYVSNSTSATIDLTQYFSNATIYALAANETKQGITFNQSNLIVDSTYNGATPIALNVVGSNTTNSSTLALTLNFYLVTLNAVPSSSYEYGTGSGSTITPTGTNITNLTYNTSGITSSRIFGSNNFVLYDAGYAPNTYTGTLSVSYNDKTLATTPLALTVYAPAISDITLNEGALVTAGTATYDSGTKTFFIVPNSTLHLAWNKLFRGLTPYTKVEINRYIKATPYTLGTNFTEKKDNFKVVNDGNYLALTPPTDTKASYDITITATNDNVSPSAGISSSSQNFKITVANPAPTKNGTIPTQTVSVNEDFSLSLSSYFNNLYSDTHFQIFPSVGGVNVSGLTFVGKPEAAGTYSVNVTAINNYDTPNTKSVTQTFNLIVLASMSDPFQNLIDRLKTGAISDVATLGFFHYTPIPTPQK